VTARRSRKELEEELGKELVEWGEQIEAVLDELPPEDDKPKGDDDPWHLQSKPKPKAFDPAERVVRDRNGRIMNCIICASERTVDGRFCKRHRDM